jgi:carbohydrate-selective porin OprB
VAGGGFKLAGEKQIGPVVAFANYVYNTAEGGGISTTVSRHTAIAGVAYLRPFNVQGEVAVSAMWAQSFANLVPGIGARNQYGVETYWNIGVTPNSSLTPGIQFIFNPAFNPGSNFVAVPHVKFRVFL